LAVLWRTGDREIFKNAYLPYRDPETLREFLKIIDEFTYDHSERLGDAFEYLLSVLGSQGDAGQFRTPRHMISGRPGWQVAFEARQSLRSARNSGHLLITGSRGPSGPPVSRAAA
jgi:hypothetical protein